VIELLAASSRLLALVAAALLAGSAVFRYGCVAARRSAAGPRSPALLGAALAVVLGHTGVLAAQLLSLAQMGPADGYAFVVGTWFGRTWLLRAVIAVALLLTVAGSAAARKPAAAHFFGAAWAAIYLGLGPLGGHAAGAESPWRILVPNIAHVLAVSIWFGALPSWLLAVRAYARGSTAALPVPDLADALARFSRLATALMLVIVASGVWLAQLYVQHAGDLLGTPYGGLIVAKLSLLTVVLWFANRLRTGFLPALRQSGPPDRQRAQARIALRHVSLELSAAGFMLVCAAWLAQTTPALHEQDPRWWLPFRWSLDASWVLPYLRPWIVAGALCTALGAALSVGHGASVRRKIGMAVTLCGAGVLSWSLAVKAYPSTYKRPPVPYITVSVAAGRQLYEEHCTRCHGSGGLGDGPAAAALPVPPADLSQPHTALHTAGDMYWWLTHGIPKSGMPPFGQVLSEQDRWDLINFLRAFSQGFESRILSPHVVSGRPWLGAINFYFDDPAGAAELKDYRDARNVLLAFLGGPDAAMRAQALADAYDGLQSRRTQVLAVRLGETQLPEHLPFPVLGAAELWSAYELLTRTVSNRGRPDRLGLDWHQAEFLIDRFGYVRARWIPEDSEPGWLEPAQLFPELEQLNAEPRLRPPPDEHIH
jgi:putative copper resistance protein D